MSIVAAATEPTANWTDAAIAIACLGVSVPLVVRMVWRGPLESSDRLPPAGSVWTLILALAWGLAAWVTVQAVYLQWRGPAIRAATQPVVAATQPGAAETQPQTLPATLPAEELAKPKPPAE